MPSRTGGAGREPELPQRKRSRRALEDDDAPALMNREMELVDVAEASSSLQQSSRAKRVRISDAKEAGARRSQTLGEEDEEEEEDDDDDLNISEDDGGEEEVMRRAAEQRVRDDEEGSEDAPLPSATQPTQPTQYENLRDMGFTHLLHEDEDDMLATQRLQRRAMLSASMAPNLSGENRRAQNGIIENVTCVNFMCHTRLECELGPLLNFIVGENGSGKSAILTAITLCLGAKASTTNRGGSLKNFIKQGEERGLLAVRIKNCGEDAFEHDVYGDSITIERHFSITGSSSFKLKSVTDRVISTKRADVDDIVEYFYLQVDNPLNVLSQDNARQFLNSSSASLKYKYFMQGIQLEQLDRDYQLVTQFLDAHSAKLPELEERVKMLKETADEAKKLHKVIQDNQDMHRRKNLYTRQLAWSQVVEQEALLEECERAVTEACNSIANAEQEREAASQKLEIQVDRLNRAEEALATLQSEDDTYKEHVERASDEYKAATIQLRVLHTDERDIHSNLKAAADRGRQLEAKIRDEQQRLEDANGERHRETQNRLVAAKKKLEEINRDISRENEQLPRLEKELAAAQTETQRMGAEVVHKRNEVQRIESQLRTLQQSLGASSSLYDAYDPNMTKLVALIERDNRFAQKPIGPLGTKIRVQKPVWSAILEKTFGSALNGFIVTTHGDQQHLSGLIRRLNMNNVPVFIANSRPINTAGKEPDAQFDTILRILEFDEPLIRDQLIINNYIEQVILVKDRKRAEQIMFNGPAPTNVVACLALHDKKRGEGLRLTSRGGGNVSTTPVTPNLGQKPRMKTDVDGQISIQREILTQGQEELDKLRAQLDVLRQKEQQCTNELKACARRSETMLKAARAAGVTIGQIEEELDRFDGADGRLQNLERELETTRTQKDQLGEQYGEVNVKKAQQSKEAEQLSKQLEAKKMEYRDFRAKVDKGIRHVEKHRDARRVALVAKNEAFEKTDMLRGRKEVAEQKRERQARLVEEFVSQARLVSPERVTIPEGETYASVEKKMEALANQLDARQRRVGMTDEEVSERAEETMKAYRQYLAIYETSTAHVTAIQDALFLRLKKWRLIQRHNSAKSRTNFIYLLSERGYRGRMLIDHRRKKLQVQVEPDETRRTVSGRDTRTLSGGEKSFSSICMLLAIWEAMGSPLRCLDEFDVFMDNVNRDVSTNMLVDTARRSVGRQYIFITPNAIQGQARHAPDVKIIRLTDPRQRMLDGM